MLNICLTYGVRRTLGNRNKQNNTKLRLLHLNKRK